MSHTIVYMTDLHGNRDALEKGLALAVEVGAKSLIIGGDVFPKTVAIVLKEKEREEEDTDEDEDVGERPVDTEEGSGFGGEVIPAHMLHDDDRTGSLYHSLKAITKVNAMQETSGVLARRLEREGSILWCCRNVFYDMESLLGEERILACLCAAFEQHEAVVGDAIRGMELTEFEEQFVLPDIAVTLRDCVEKSLPAEVRLAFARKMANVLQKDAASITEQDFDRVAPSRYLDAFIAYTRNPREWIRLEEMSAALRTTLESVRGEGGYAYKLLKQRIEQARDFFQDAIDVMGQCPAAFFRLAAQHTALRKLMHEATTLEFIREGQRAFLNGYLLPLLREFRRQHPGIDVYFMLGNDDHADLEPLVEEAAAEGILRYVHNTVHPFGDGWEIAGYAFVRPSPYDYKAWERSERTILTDLERLHGQARDPSRTVWVVHNPPWRSRLDLAQRACDAKPFHIGSGAVRLFLRRGMGGPLALFGHVHESPYVEGGVYHEVIGGTICVNPGAEHTARGLHAVVFNLEDIAGTLRHTLLG